MRAFFYWTASYVAIRRLRETVNIKRVTARDGSTATNLSLYALPFAYSISYWISQSPHSQLEQEN